MKLSEGAGALVCARYAMAPNLYRYCGPDTEQNLGKYVEEETVDEGLVEYLAKFETLFPYLEVIARANGIGDPLNRRVVEAYWVGNELLEQVKEKELYQALTEIQLLPKRLPKKEAGRIIKKIERQARLHHSFHVLNVFTKTGWRMRAETVETMDECRISWGKIIRTKNQIPSPKQVPNSKIQLKTQKLIYKEGRLQMVPAVKEVMVLQESLAKRIKTGDYVSVHWGMACDKLSEKAVKRLSYYTEQSIRLANETL